MRRKHSLRRAELFEELQAIKKLKKIEDAERKKAKSEWRKKWDRKSRGKKKKIFVLVFPLMHSGKHSRAERDWMRKVYESDVKKVLNDKNARLLLLVEPENLKQFSGKSKRMLLELEKEGRLFFLREPLPKDLMEGDRKLIVRGERADLCAPNIAGHLTRRLGLKLEDVRIELEDSFLFDESRKDHKVTIDSDTALSSFLEGYRPGKYIFGYNEEKDKALYAAHYDKRAKRRFLRFNFVLREELDKDVKELRPLWRKIFKLSKEKKRLKMEEHKEKLWEASEKQ
ncbi:hypothetical protein DRN74_03125 [Candidatus Micrarchaeota archaeon]|nr:MAG: hypothetical protein DRN74_03125 [Candidatus Micrarchaeota archaeon]